MYGELRWSHVDRLASHYGAARAHVSRLDSLAMELTQVCEGLEHRPFTMTDLSSFLSPRVDPSTEMTRAVAWVCQHVFQSRAWSVGQKIVEAPRNCPPHSPLVRQLEKLGVSAETNALAGVIEAWPESIPKQDKLDCLLFNPEKDAVYLVKGQSSGTAHRLSPALAMLRPEDRRTLFGDEKAAICQIYCQTENIAALCFAFDVIRACCPQLTVRAFFGTVEDPGGSGRFQFHEISKSTTERLGNQRFALDTLPVIATHEDFHDWLEQDPEALYHLPAWPEADYLRKAPVDLPIRALMILKQLRTGQMECSRRLYLRPPREIARSVSETHNLHYPKNMARHDIDRLQKVGLLEWAPNGSVTVGITPAGIARTEVLEFRFNPMLPRSPGRMLDAVATQETHWVDAALV